jgi:hypothetical protein
MDIGKDCWDIIMSYKEDLEVTSRQDDCLKAVLHELKMKVFMFTPLLTTLDRRREKYMIKYMQEGIQIVEWISRRVPESYSEWEY